MKEFTVTTIRERCNCGERIMHNNGGNYHAIFYVVGDTAVVSNTREFFDGDKPHYVVSDGQAIWVDYDPDCKSRWEYEEQTGLCVVTVEPTASNIEATEVWQTLQEFPDDFDVYENVYELPA